MFPNGKATHLISDEDMGKLFRHLDRIEAEGRACWMTITPAA